MKKVQFLSLLVIFSFIFQSISAQNKFEVHIGGALPQGGFADNNTDQAIYGSSGCAETGVLLGAKFLHQFSSIKDLSLTFSADYSINSLSQKFKDEVSSSLKNQINNTSVSLNFKYPSYTNIPILVGLNYDILINPQTDFFINGGIGINFVSVSDLTATAKFNGLSATETISTNSAQGFAGQIGGGILFGKRISLGINYNLLGSYKLSGKDKASNDAEVSIASLGSLSINTLNLYIGYRF